MSRMDEERIRQCFEAVARFELSDDVRARDLKRVKQGLTACIRGQKTEHRDIWRTIMKSKVSKIATAAVIIIVVIVSIHYFGGSAASVAWGEIVRNVEKIRMFTYKQTETTELKEQDSGSKSRETTIAYISSEYGLKEECYRNGQIHTIAYYLRPERMLVAISPQHKLYERRPLTEAELQGIDNRADTRWIVKRFMSVQHIKLGPTILTE